MVQSAQYEPPRFTYADYLQWSDAERWELVNGEAFCMTPAPTTTHQRVVLEIGTQLRGLLRGHKCEAFIAPFDVRFCEPGTPDEEVRDILQPDIVVVCDPKKIDERGCKGAPDFIVEITSPSTSARDKTVKLGVYEKYGVREYWIVDLQTKLVSVYLFDAASGRYAPPSVLEMQGKRAVVALAGLEVDLDEVLAESKVGE
ncbi:TPA: Uma2 family endonuclease [Candidatus Sumerlaeota bacterium]|nr:Uma2 family endonuclease [Candidatus Sumerlaeota bacterium]